MHPVIIRIPHLEFEIEALDEEDYITACMRKFGNWEPNVTCKFLDIIEGAISGNVKGVVIDAGACFGYYSIISALKGMQVYSFEPNPSTFSILEKNISRNSLTNILSFKNAIGSQQGKNLLATIANNAGGAHILSDQNKNTIAVDVLPLDTLSINNRILIYKIDVEGFEAEVIKGSIATIRKNPADFIFVEVSPKFNSAEDIINGIFQPLWDENYISFNIGLQDSGEIDKALNTFEILDTSAHLYEFLQLHYQTNVLFIKKEKRGSLLATGATWKDQLIFKWILGNQLEHEETLKNFEQGLKSKSIELEDLRGENAKLFKLLTEAGEYQEQLIKIIHERDNQIAQLSERE